MSKVWWHIETMVLAALAFIAGAGIGTGILLLVAHLVGEL